jgi:hypothetical protein
VLTAAAGSQGQIDALTNVGVLDRTPFWYYTLVEAAHHCGSPEIFALNRDVIDNPNV